MRNTKRLLKKHEILASSFDKLRMRLRVISGLALMVSLSRFGGLTVRPWATSFDRLILRQAQDEVEPFQRLKPHGELVEP
jgi:hypothetical protein